MHLASTYLLFLILAIRNHYLGNTSLAAMLFVFIAIIDSNAIYKGLFLPINIVISTLVVLCTEKKLRSKSSSNAHILNKTHK